jgi:G:T-mismatch repair DNA endonuclease (very short patch repair protein)
MEKIAKTVQKDNQNIMLLYRSGWTPLVVWECE